MREHVLIDFLLWSTQLQLEGRHLDFASVVVLELANEGLRLLLRANSLELPVRIHCAVEPLELSLNDLVKLCLI